MKLRTLIEHGVTYTIQQNTIQYNMIARITR